MSAVRAHAVISGRVQGVFFRAEAAARARSLGLAGWVRNLPDGTVEAVFEGPEEPSSRCSAGASGARSGARVDAVDVTWEQPAGDATFEVR